MTLTPLGQKIAFRRLNSVHSGVTSSTTVSKRLGLTKGDDSEWKNWWERTNAEAGKHLMFLKKTHRGIGLAFFNWILWHYFQGKESHGEKKWHQFSLMVSGKMFGIFNITTVKALMEFRQFRNKPWNYVRISNVPLLLNHTDFPTDPEKLYTVQNCQILAHGMKQTVHGVTLTWAWWWLQIENPHSWRGCCQSSQCPSLWRTASWTAAACKSGWSGRAATRDVHLGRWSAAPASEKTGGSGCSPSERELSTGDTAARVESEVSTRKSHFQHKKNDVPWKYLAAAPWRWCNPSGLCHTAGTAPSTSAWSPTVPRSRTRLFCQTVSCQTCLTRKTMWGKNIHSPWVSTMLFTIPICPPQTEEKWEVSFSVQAHHPSHAEPCVLESHAWDYCNDTSVAGNVQNKHHLEFFSAQLYSSSSSRAFVWPSSCWR